MSTEVFYPNDLTLEEIRQLSGWKLQIAALHFGDKRIDCVTNDYGYSVSCPLSPSSSIGDNQIYLVSSNRKHHSPIPLEEKWDGESLLKEYNISTVSILRNEIEKKLMANYFEETKEEKYEINNEEIIKFNE